MIAPLLMMAQATTPPLPPVSEPDDIVVIGRRLAGWSGEIVSNPFGTHCHTTRSTGDVVLDNLGCAAMSDCWPTVRTGYRQVEDRHREQGERDRIKAAIDAAFAACTKTRRATLIAALPVADRTRIGAVR